MLVTIMAMLQPLLASFIGANGWALQVISIIGTLRLIFKPLQSFVAAIIAATPSVNDDAWLAKAMASKAYGYVQYALDWFASVKLPAKK